MSLVGVTKTQIISALNLCVMRTNGTFLVLTHITVGMPLAVGTKRVHLNFAEKDLMLAVGVKSIAGSIFRVHLVWGLQELLIQGK